MGELRPCDFGGKSRGGKIRAPPRAAPESEGRFDYCVPLSFMLDAMTSLADILGPWVDPNFESGLIARCKLAWNKPLQDLTKADLATLLRQRIAPEHILPIAKARITDGINDDTEMFDGELQEAIDLAARYP